MMLSFSFLIAFLLHLLLFATAPMVTPIMEEMKLSHARFGFLFSVAIISLTASRIPWGLIADKIGYLNTFRVALPLTAVSAMLRAFSPSYPVFLVCQFFLGSGLGAILPSLPLIVKEWSSTRVLGLSTGIYVSGFALGNGTALALTPHLVRMMSWREVLLAYSGLAGVVSVLWWGLARSDKKRRVQFQLESFTRVLRDRYVWILLFFMIASMGCYDTLATWMPKVLTMKNLNPALASLLPLGFFMAGPIVGFISDRLKNKERLVPLLSAVAAGTIMGINYAPGPLLFLCIFLSGFLVIGVLTITLAVPAEQERFSDSVGSVVGIISSLGNLGPLVMPVLFGFLIDMTGTFQASVLTVAFLAGVTSIISATRRGVKQAKFPPLESS